MPFTRNTSIHGLGASTRGKKTRSAQMRALPCAGIVLAIVTVCASTYVIRAQSSHEVSAATVQQWMTALSNWGRWGDEDQLGTLNFITPETRRRALASTQEGISVSLSHNYLKDRAEDVSSPLRHEMLLLDSPSPFRNDQFTIAHHGFAHSHVDALCHMAHDGQMYNGFNRAAEVTASGCAMLGIDAFKHGIISRGVLMDIPRLKGVEYLEPGTPIYVEDLRAWERMAGITVRRGDIVLVRGGRWARRREVGPWDTAQSAAGLHVSVVPWLREREVAMVGSDDTNDVRPSGVDGVRTPVHQILIVAMGMPLLDNLDLEAVAAEAVRQDRWEFTLVAAPLTVEGGTGSPLNPLALF